MILFYLSKGATTNPYFCLYLLIHLTHSFLQLPFFPKNLKCPFYLAEITSKLRTHTTLNGEAILKGLYSGSLRVEPEVAHFPQFQLLAINHGW